MDDFMNILKSGDKKKLNDYLLKNSKKPKPISPIYFEKKIFNKEENKNGNTEHEGTNE
jgi:hypothetical protein